MNTDDAFQTRMVAQVCQIVKYRKIRQRQGRKLSFDEAAFEWISRYAAKFPPLEHSQVA